MPHDRGTFRPCSETKKIICSVSAALKNEDATNIRPNKRIRIVVVFDVKVTGMACVTLTC